MPELTPEERDAMEQSPIVLPEGLTFTQLQIGPKLKDGASPIELGCKVNSEQYAMQMMKDCMGRYYTFTSFEGRGMADGTWEVFCTICEVETK